MLSPAAWNVATDRRRVHEQRGHRRPGRERLVEVEHVELLVAQGADRAQRRGRVGGERGDRAVGRGRQAVAERGDERRRRRAVARREHAHLDAHRPQRARQAQHLALHAAGDRQAVRADHRRPAAASAARRVEAARLAPPRDPSQAVAGTLPSRDDRTVVLRRPAMPALSLIGVPGKRGAILELAAEADRRGFAGLASPGIHGNLALCGSLAHVTSTIPFWTSIQPIYHSPPGRGGDHRRPPRRGQRRPLPARSRRQPRPGDEPPRARHRQAAVGHPQLRRGPPRRRAPGRAAAADLPGHAARQDARPRRRDRRRGDLGQRLARAHAHAGGPHPGRPARLVRPGQHGADGDRRRQGRGPGHPPAHADRLRDPAELPQLLEGGRLRGRDGGHRGRPRRRRPRRAARR